MSKKGSEEQSRNLFDSKPDGNVVGLEEEKRKIAEYIKHGGVCFLTGPSGIGKTSLVKWVESTLKEHRIVYIDAKGMEDTFNLQKHLLRQGNFLMRLFRIYPKNMVVIIDEAQETSKRFIDVLQSMWDSNVVKSIIIVQISPNLKNFPESFVNRIGDRVIRLKRADFELVRKILEARTEGKQVFDFKALELIAKKSGFIPRNILQKCEVISTELNQSEEIGLQDVKHIIDKKEEEELEQAADMDIFDPRRTEVKTEVFLSFDKIDNSKDFTDGQKVVIKLLSEGKKTANQLSTILNSPLSNVTKVLDDLARKDAVNCSGKPKTFELSDSFKKEMT